jgi:prepilin-type N-terminal cleavage/methylation domain-containing protein
MQRGVSLIELMVALVIGLFLIFGAVTIYQQSRATLRTTEAVARLQEVARLAFDVLEADVRMANYWGLNNRAEFIVNRAAPGQGLPAPFTAGQGAIISQCGSNWGINLDEYIAGFPEETRQVLEDMRTIIREVAPDATETISYGIPTFDLNGKHLVHFAGYAKHIGFYPVPSGMSATASASESVLVVKGSASMPSARNTPPYRESCGSW